MLVVTALLVQCLESPDVFICVKIHDHPADMFCSLQSSDQQLNTLVYTEEVVVSVSPTFICKSIPLNNLDDVFFFFYASAFFNAKP